MSERKTAFVTGASRGIGKAIAISLAEGGFDVAITARTVEPGEQREHSSSVKVSDTTPLPGSLSETAAIIEKLGQKVIMAPADIIDRVSLGAAAQLVLDQWGHVDVLVNNARFIGAGHMDTILGAPVSAVENHMQGNFFAPLVFIKAFAPKMIERGHGRIINLTSASGYSDPLSPAGEGGWGISYGASKAAIHRVAGILAAELGPKGIYAFNLDPGYTSTERIAQDMSKYGFADDGEPAEVIGVAARWLASEDEAKEMNGQTIFGQLFTIERNLLPGYTGLKKLPAGSRPDLSGARFAAIVAGEGVPLKK
ncbi:MAG: putative short chain dehydrogenase/reductase [Acidimicrobiia bacterium]|nr:putative short chain dehydrogenase/reductase [Acidimicrobiia bacterium]